MYARTLPELLEAITAPAQEASQCTVTTSDYVCWRQVGHLVWEVRRYRIGGVVYRIAIICHVIEGNDEIGWSAEKFYERDDLEHVSCPLEFLGLVTQNPSWTWRDPVWQFHEAKLA